ncbi:MAG TPA: hypothetical protein VGH22_02535 [Candidatus Binatia bacterium]|jgi:hypothetical protein
MLLGGSIAFAWTRGVLRSPERPAKFGALTGIIMGAVVNAAHWIFEGPARQPFGQQIDQTILDMLQWGFYGFFGGLALEKCWGKCPAVRVAFGVGVACVVATFFHAFYAESLHSSWLEQFKPEIFNDPSRQRLFAFPGFWMDELMQQFLPAAGWALAIFLLPRSNEALQRHDERHASDGDMSTEIRDASSSKEATKIPAFKDQFETARAATIGVTAGLIFCDAIFTGDTLSCDLAPWIKFLFSIGFPLWLNFKYLDPFLERLGGPHEPELDSRSRFRKISLLSVSAAIPVTVFMQLNDKLMMEKPMGMLLWLVGVFSGGAITYAWARGACRSPGRAAEFGALTGVIVPSIMVLALHSFGRMLGFFVSIDRTVVSVVGAILEWGLYGLLGGLLIERGRRTWLPIRVASGIVVGGLIVIGGLMVASLGVTGMIASFTDLFSTDVASLCSRSSPSNPNAWATLTTFIRVFFVAIGWAWGLMLFPKSEDVLRIRTN